MAAIKLHDLPGRVGIMMNIRGLNEVMNIITIEIDNGALEVFGLLCVLVEASCLMSLQDF
jgi:hypothetical protein